MCVGRLWQSTQSIVRHSVACLPSGVSAAGASKRRVVPSFADHLDLVDRLALLVRAVADDVVGVDVPVDALAAAGLAAAHLHHQHGLHLGVGLVLLEVGVDLEPVAHELVRPVALLAGLARRAQVVDGHGDRPRVEVERHRDELPGAGELGLHEPVRARADVALHALHPRVRRALVGRVLGLHHRVAGGAAELRRLHHLDALVGARPPRIISVDDRSAARKTRTLRRTRSTLRSRPAAVVRRLPRPAAAVAHALAPEAERDQRQPEDEDAGDDQEGEDAEVRAAVVADEVEREQRDEQDRADRGEDGAGQADRVARDRARRSA